MRLLAVAAAILLASGCAPSAHTVATDLQTTDKPVLSVCQIKWPQKPIPHVAIVQLSGDPLKDLVAIERAKEAELEERIAYEAKLEAAALACVK